MRKLEGYNSALHVTGLMPANEFDPVEFFNCPSSSLVDYAIHHDKGFVFRYYSQPCFMNLAEGARRTVIQGMSRFDPNTLTYLAREPDTEIGKATHIWICLRMSSTSNYGMDYEDDTNRDEIDGGYDYDYDYDDEVHYHDVCKTTEDDELALKWWKYVFSQRYSPWRQALIAPVEYLKNADGRIIAAKLTIDETIHSQTFVSMCIASRWPWENLGHLRLWGKMREAGFKRYESLYVSSHIRFLRNEKDIGFRTCSGHFTFAPWETNINIKWLRDGTPDPDDLMLTKDYYHGVEYIWNDISRPVYYIKDTVLYPILRSEVNQYSGSFGKAFERSQEHNSLTGVLGTWDVVLPKLRENYDKWKA